MEVTSRRTNWKRWPLIVAALIVLTVAGWLTLTPYLKRQDEVGRALAVFRQHDSSFDPACHRAISFRESADGGYVRITFERTKGNGPAERIATVPQHPPLTFRRIWGSLWGQSKPVPTPY